MHEKQEDKAVKNDVLLPKYLYFKCRQLIRFCRIYFQMFRLKNAYRYVFASSSGQPQ